MKFFFIPAAVVETHSHFIDEFTNGNDPLSFECASRAIGKKNGVTAEMLMFVINDDTTVIGVIYRLRSDTDVSIIAFSDDADEKQIFAGMRNDPIVTEATEEQFNAMKNKALATIMDL